MNKTDDKSIHNPPWTLEANDIFASLNVSKTKGLTTEEVGRRRKIYGKNQLREPETRSAWLIFLQQFKSLIVGLLVAATVLSFLFGDFAEALAIIAVILINAAIGFFTEIRAVRSMEALRKMSDVLARVRREGEDLVIPAQELVPGDIVLLEGGDIISADLRTIEASKLQVDESTLTGESLPVSKDIDPIDETAPLAERSNMLYKGTALTRGSAMGVVVDTGMNTELGHISALVEAAEDETTPLEERLDQLGQRLIWLTLIIAVIVAAMGILGGKEVMLMIETSIALAVAAIPEGLPIVATIALAKGMLRMARQNALIRRLASVETLGATTVICTDKTGTLTENRMTVTRIMVDSGTYTIRKRAEKSEIVIQDKPTDPKKQPDLLETLAVGVLCNNASLGPERDGAGIGDPLEVALLRAGVLAGLDRKVMLQRMPELREEAFDSDTKMMATYHPEGKSIKVAVKGAPEHVLDSCSFRMAKNGIVEFSSADKKKWDEANDRMAEEGLRILAMATRQTASSDDRPYEKLVFLGLIGLVDPPRDDVRPAIETCHRAGIKVVMVTGDQPVTARNIAHFVGLVDNPEAEVLHGRDLEDLENAEEEKRRHLRDVPVFARVSPKQKLDLIAIHQENREVVAMTGDGVNDAPALKKSDIGIAMGMRGTQVAREASDMVLKDDSFPTIVTAIRQGRIIFNNIRKFVLYLLSCNVSEIVAVGTASIVNAPLPILPLQILYLNLVTDVFPALALGVGAGERGIMDQTPRDTDEPLLTKRHWIYVLIFGSILALAALGAFAYALLILRMDMEHAVTVTFLTLAFSQLLHVFNMRGQKSGLLRNEIISNGYVWLALTFCIGLLLVALYVPVVADVLKLHPPGFRGWTVIAIASAVPWVIGQLVLIVGSRKK